MAKEIWNEGRVVGYSAYEQYVKRALAADPTVKVATEQEWLASSLAMGSSMVLKIPSKNYATTYDTVEGGTLYTFQCRLPENSRLRAANTIIAAPFFGTAHVDVPESAIPRPAEGYGIWADKITKYGCGWKNDTSVPSSASYALPTVVHSMETLDDFYPEVNYYRYVHIVDGSVEQNGTWSEVTPSSNQPPKADLSPNLSIRSYVTITMFIPDDEESQSSNSGDVQAAEPGYVGDLPTSYKDKNDDPLWIILTGFTDSAVLVGEIATRGSVGTDHPENGDFLGPSTFPWGAKILFVSPSVFLGSLDADVRKASTDVEKLKVRVSAIEPIVPEVEKLKLTKQARIEDALEINSDWHVTTFNFTDTITGRQNVYAVKSEFPIMQPSGMLNRWELGLGGFATPETGLVLGPFNAPRPDAIPVWEMGSDDTFNYSWGGYAGEYHDVDGWRQHRYLGHKNIDISVGGDEGSFDVLAQNGDLVSVVADWPCPWTVTTDLSTASAQSDVTIRGTGHVVHFSHIPVGQVVRCNSTGSSWQAYIKLIDSTNTVKWAEYPSKYGISTARQQQQIFQYVLSADESYGWWAPANTDSSIVNIPNMPQFEYSIERKVSFTHVNVLGDSIRYEDAEGAIHGVITEGGREAPYINGQDINTVDLSDDDWVRYNGVNYHWAGEWQAWSEPLLNPAYIRIWGCVGLEPDTTVYGKIRWLIPPDKGVTT